MLLVAACKRSFSRLDFECRTHPSTMLTRSFTCYMKLHDQPRSPCSWTWLPASAASYRESVSDTKRNCFGRGSIHNLSDDVCAGCHPIMCQNGSKRLMGSSSAFRGATARSCQISREGSGHWQANIQPSVAGVKLDHDKVLSSCHRKANCPPGEQAVNDHAECPAFECDRTFCPQERGDHCPLADQGLTQPRGDQSLTRRLDGAGLQNLKRSLKCPRAYRALLVDAAGTLIDASQSTQEIYHEIGLKYGVQFSEKEIAAKYKAAYGQPWCRYRMRYEDDGRFFWQRIVQETTGCKDPGLLEELYQYYTTDKAWHIADPDAERALKAIREVGVKVAVVSNFDTRLRPLMRVLQCYDWFDNILVSAEVGLEKPNPEIFLRACRELGVTPEQALHVGDDEINDIVGASEAGCDSLLWGVEVTSFSEVAKKLGVEV